MQGPTKGQSEALHHLESWVPSSEVEESLAALTVNQTTLARGQPVGAGGQSTLHGDGLQGAIRVDAEAADRAIA